MIAPDWLKNFGYTGERRAVALLSLALLMSFYLFLGLNALVGSPEIAPYLLAMCGVYLIGFFAVGAEWFWARWYAQGLAWSGVLEAAFGLLSIVRMRDDFPPEVLKLFLVFFGVLGSLHGLTGVSLLGPRIAERYDARDDWRKRWQLDEQGALKVRRAVTRAATSLPMIIALALAPRQDQGLVTFAALVLGAVGLTALLRGRSIGVLALGTAGAVLVASGLLHPTHLVLSPGVASPLLPSTFVPALPLIAGALLLAAFAPFARSIATHLARR
jgi:hypothetical protein